MAEYKTFKVSQLCAIQNIDGDDLLMVSDYEGGKCYTRKMTVAQLFSAISASPQVQAAIKNEVSRQLTADMTQNVMKIIKENHQDIYDLMTDGIINQQVIIGQ